uniref:WD repeat domain-containing protein 83 n=1 Tax=Panagrellus redivivus TaxID=6233 RepID=A0A7E4W233_PANRE
MEPSTSKPLPTKLSHSFACQQGALRTVRFNNNGNYALTGGVDKSVRLWNPYDAALLHNYTGCGGEVRAVDSSADNSMILAGGLDKIASVFDVESGKLLKRFRGHGSWINAVAFDDDSSLAFSAGQEGSLIVWDLRDRREVVQTIDDATDAVLSLDMTGSQIVTGSADHKMRLYDVRQGWLSVTDLGAAVTDVHLTDDNQCVLAASIGQPLKLIEKINGEPLAEYKGHTCGEFRIEAGVLPSNDEVVTGSEDSCAYIYDFVSMKIKARLDHAPAKYIHSLTVHPKKACVLTASRDRVFVWTTPNA